MYYLLGCAERWHCDTAARMELNCELRTREPEVLLHLASTVLGDES